MNNIESILLTYENENRIQYQYYAEFFRFIGVYVCENLKVTVEQDRDFDSSQFDFSVNYEVKSENKNNKETLLNILSKKLGETQIWCEELIDIFEKFKLMQASVTLQYFRMNDRLILNAGNSFKNAADSLVELVRNNPEYLKNKYVRYAKLYCKQKANFAQFLFDESVIYYVDDLAAEGLTILKVFPDFANVWVLLGMIYEISKDFGRDAIDAFQRGIEGIEHMPFTSSIYYWLGKQCGKYIALKQIEEESYNKAYKLMRKYRNIYKVAQIYYGKKDWKKALEYFEECIHKIERKGDFLDPLEQEYYFKVCVQMASIYLKLEDYNNVINMADKAINLKKGIKGGLKGKNEHTSFYFMMYSAMVPEEYIELALSRMGTKQAYQCLAIAYQELGIQEEAEKNWQLYRE